MDEGLSQAVREVFVRLYEEGLIYRGERLINWCPRCHTALSDIEVEHEDTKGKLYHIRYPLADDPTVFLIVATTRPETMLGDTAVAVHPDDSRYRHMIGKKVRLPLMSRDIPIVGDPILVDREFGTGAVKITPAHDFNDFEAGERHHLPRLRILDYHARLNLDGLTAAAVEQGVIQEIVGFPVGKARLKIEELLQSRGFLEKVDDHKMAVGKCYRCKTIVEPYLSPQWFVKIQPLADPAVKAVEDGRIRLIPEGWTNNYLGWMREIKDWCISRQIWWGHQIPAWYCRSCQSDAILLSAQSTKSFTITSSAQPIVGRIAPTHCPNCGTHDFVRDPDVLDTWFSSALWPFSTLGWPEETRDLKTFYPTSTLVTGLDILFFWVARMIMMGLKFTDQVPFRDVYIHALVRDAEGQKMSKSKGNVIDPLSVMDQYGTDALRFTLASMASPGRDIKLAEERIQGYRNFANKIWNAARFIVMNLEGPRERINPIERSFADRWILSRLNRTIGQVATALEQYRFDHVSGVLYQFIWHEYCDWYLELIKPALQDKDSQQAQWTRVTLIESFEIIQRLLHPLMPFLTEEIWQALPRSAERGESIMIQPYPSPVPEWAAKGIEGQFSVLEQGVSLTRTGRALLNYPPGKPVTVFAAATNQETVAVLRGIRSHVEHLARGTIEITPIETWPTKEILQLVQEGMTIGLAVDHDVDVRKILDRIGRQQQDGVAELNRLSAKLANTGFTAKAPSEVIEEHHRRVQAIQHEQDLLKASEQQLRAMMESRG